MRIFDFALIWMISSLMSCLTCRAADQARRLTVQIVITKCEPLSLPASLDQKRWGVWATIVGGSAAELKKHGFKAGEEIVVRIHSPVMTFGTEPHHLRNVAYELTYLGEPSRIYSGEFRASKMEKPQGK